MQWCTDTVMMLLHWVKADGSERFGWEGGSTMQVAVWFARKERSPILSPQMQQKTTCRQPASPPAPACVPSSPRSPRPLLLVQPWVISATHTPSAAPVLYPRSHQGSCPCSSGPSGHGMCKTWTLPLLYPVGFAAQRRLVMIFAGPERVLRDPFNKCVRLFNGKTCLPATISSLQHCKQSQIQLTPRLNSA